MICLTLAVALLAAPPRAQEPKPDDAAGRQQARDDLARLQGSWACTVLESQGMRTEFEAPTRIAEYKGDQLTLIKDGKKYRTGLVTLDPTQTPKALNTWDLDGPNKDRTSIGIYEIDGDTLKVCFAEPGDDRPKEFSTAKGTGYLYIIYKRVKP